VLRQGSLFPLIIQKVPVRLLCHPLLHAQAEIAGRDHAVVAQSGTHSKDEWSPCGRKLLRWTADFTAAARY